MMTPEALFTKVLRKQILDLSAYKVADAANLIKLDAMENPYTWPTTLVSEWLEQLRPIELNRYPDPYATRLTQALRIQNKISEHSGILLGNGSDELIQLLLMALPTDSKVLAPEPSFVMYKQICLSLELDYHGIPLESETFDLDLDAFLTAIEKYQPALIFIAYPNNPTGNLFNPESIHAIIKTAPGLVVIDEAYAPFANASLLPRLTDYPNLILMRTVSKLGLAGLRLGYMAGAQALIDQLNKIRLPYNINTLTQVSAEFALTNHSVFEQQTALICAERTRVMQELNALPGIFAFPSAANFILFRTPKNTAETLFNSIKQQGILIKNLAGHGGLLADCLRVTIGTPNENQQFLQALTYSLKLL